MLDRVAVGFGERVLFSDVSLRISDRDRIGLVGPNGSGKTTILRVLAGRQPVDRGNVHVARGVRIGYLPQDLDFVDAGQTLRQLVLESVPGRRELDSELARAEAELEQRQQRDDGGDDVLELAERIAELHERIDHFETYYSEHEALRILAGLGFATRDHDRDLSEFSGGWKMRGHLAALLFQQPDLLLLDEPTNHLDMPSVAWFSDFLVRTKRAFMLISHDREFLNEQISRVVSLELEGVRGYTGNYDQYEAQRAEEAEILEAKSRNIAREKEHMQRFIDRFRAKNTKAAAVQSRIKKLEKLDEVELYQERRVMRLKFPPTERAVGDVIKVDNLRKAYGDNVVFDRLSLIVRRGEKIAIIGPNGAGKTTLLKVMAGELAADGGRVDIGNNVKLGYYAQHHAETLDRSATAYQVVDRANPQATPARIRGVLGAFLFSGDDVDKKVSVLSGGERARVALSRLLISPGNLLLMDEPTNHLDLDSSEQLADALADYDGTLVFVSHNRSLIRQVATKIWNIEAGQVETYPGTLDEYIYSQQQRARGQVVGGDRPRASGLGPQGPDDNSQERRTREDDKARKRREAELRQKRSKRLGPIERRIAELEARIAELETEQKHRSGELSDPTVYADAPRRDGLLAAFRRDADKIEELTLRWESATEELAAEEAALAGEE